MNRTIQSASLTAVDGVVSYNLTTIPSSSQNTQLNNDKLNKLIYDSAILFNTFFPVTGVVSISNIHGRELNKLTTASAQIKFSKKSEMDEFTYNTILEAQINYELCYDQLASKLTIEKQDFLKPLLVQHHSIKNNLSPESAKAIVDIEVLCKKLKSYKLLIDLNPDFFDYCIQNNVLSRCIEQSKAIVDLIVDCSNNCVSHSKIVCEGIISSYAIIWLSFSSVRNFKNVTQVQLCARKETDRLKQQIDLNFNGFYQALSTVKGDSDEFISKSLKTHFYSRLDVLIVHFIRNFIDCKSGNKHQGIPNQSLINAILLLQMVPRDYQFGTVAKQKFSDLGAVYEAVYENLIENGILHRIDDNNARLAIPKEELDDKLNVLTPDQKNKVLPILQQSQFSYDDRFPDVDSILGQIELKLSKNQQVAQSSNSLCEEDRIEIEKELIREQEEQRQEQERQSQAQRDLSRNNINLILHEDNFFDSVDSDEDFFDSVDSEEVSFYKNYNEAREQILNCMGTNFLDTIKEPERRLLIMLEELNSNNCEPMTDMCHLKKLLVNYALADLYFLKGAFDFSSHVSQIQTDSTEKSIKYSEYAIGHLKKNSEDFKRNNFNVIDQVFNGLRIQMDVANTRIKAAELSTERRLDQLHQSRLAAMERYARLGYSWVRNIDSISPKAQERRDATETLKQLKELKAKMDLVQRKVIVCLKLSQRLIPASNDSGS